MRPSRTSASTLSNSRVATHISLGFLSQWQRQSISILRKPKLVFSTVRCGRNIIVSKIEYNGATRPGLRRKNHSELSMQINKKIESHLIEEIIWESIKYNRNPSFGKKSIKSITRWNSEKDVLLSHTNTYIYTEKNCHCKESELAATQTTEVSNTCSSGRGFGNLPTPSATLVKIVKIC